MSTAETDVAKELVSRREALGISRERVARAVGVSAKTIERWENSGRVKPVELQTLRAFFRQAEADPLGLDNVVPRGTMRVSETTRVEFGLPDWIERRAVAVERDLARAGATDAQLDYVSSVLRGDATVRLILFNDDGARRPQKEQERQFEDLVDLMRLWVERSRSTREREAFRGHPVRRTGRTGREPAAPAPAVRRVGELCRRSSRDLSR
jgi:transcriptional regulator with XRE-family HTH domain